MAAEAMQKLGESRGIEIKVETQGCTGIENEITADDIARADGAIIAAEIAIEGAERFEDIPTLECPVAAPIKQGEDVFDAIIGEINNG